MAGIDSRLYFGSKVTQLSLLRVSSNLYSPSSNAKQLWHLIQHLRHQIGRSRFGVDNRLRSPDKDSELLAKSDAVTGEDFRIKERLSVSDGLIWTMKGGRVTPRKRKLLFPKSYGIPEKCISLSRPVLVIDRSAIKSSCQVFCRQVSVLPG